MNSGNSVCEFAHPAAEKAVFGSHLHFYRPGTFKTKDRGRS
jgi:hypothetical protein